MEQPPGSVFSDSVQPLAAGRGRDSLLLSARLRVDGMADEMGVRVRNLSAGGLMAEVAGSMTLADRAVEVELRQIGWVAGRIAWQTEGRVGIAFDTPIDPLRVRRPVVSDD